MHLRVLHIFGDFTTLAYRYPKWHKTKVKVRLLQLNRIGLQFTLMFDALKETLLTAGA